MPSEQDNKMEELLKAYAQKRREQAGAPLELHPATRKLLQAEVARQHPKPLVEGGSFFQLLARFWPRLAFVVSAVIVSGLIFWTVHEKQSSHRDLARVEMKAAPEPLAESLQLAKDSPASSDYFFRTPATNSNSGAVGGSLNITSGPAGNLTLADNSSARENSLAFNSPADPKFKQRFDLDGRGLNERESNLGQAGAAPQPSVNTTLALGASKESLARKAEPPPSKPAPVVAGQELDGAARNAQPIGPPEREELSIITQPKTIGLSKQGTRVASASALTSDRIHFAQVNELAKGGRLQNQAAPTPLSSFELEQNGNSIRIYDADGSVYVGQVTPGADALLKAAGPSATDEVRREFKLAQEKKAQPAPNPIGLGDAESGQRPGSFQASGTNRTLQQLVVINASLVSATKPEGKSEANLPLLAESQSARDTKKARPTIPVPSQAPPAAARAPEPLRQSSTAVLLRVQGRAKIGPTQELEIDAIRAPR